MFIMFSRRLVLWKLEMELEVEPVQPPPHDDDDDDDRDNSDIKIPPIDHRICHESII